MLPIRRERQREALKLLATGLFGFDSFRFKPEFMQRLVQDYLDRGDAFDVGLSPPGLDYSLPDPGARDPAAGAEAADERHRRAAHPRQPGEARAVDTGIRARRALRRAAARDLERAQDGQDIDLFRRNLQREHANRVAGALVRPSGSMPADARA